MAARPLDAYLNSAGALSRLSAHAGRLLKLQRIYVSIAPSHLAASSRVANLKLGKLLIHADSGAVAAKLRQILPGLLDKFSSEDAQVTEIRIKVQPPDAALQHIRRRDAPPALGAVARSELARLATELPEDSPLREALRRLVDKSR
jgi:hypothetical protein